jgi:hypothetical protein
VCIPCSSAALEPDKETISLSEELDDGTALRIRLDRLLRLLVGSAVAFSKLPAKEQGEDARRNGEYPGRASQPRDKARGARRADARQEGAAGASWNGLWGREEGKELRCAAHFSCGGATASAEGEVAFNELEFVRVKGTNDVTR